MLKGALAFFIDEMCHVWMQSEILILFNFFATMFFFFKNKLYFIKLFLNKLYFV
jgi:hypothetical protein